MDKCWPAIAMLKPVDLCLLISTQDMSQTYVSVINILAYIKKPK